VTALDAYFYAVPLSKTGDTQLMPIRAGYLQISLKDAQYGAVFYLTQEAVYMLGINDARYKYKTAH
jgi:hypothetical protein